MVFNTDTAEYEKQKLFWTNGTPWSEYPNNIYTVGIDGPKGSKYTDMSL
jgi:hypothetical protein